MQYRHIPKTGDRLSVLGFGCMRLPQKRGNPGSGRIDKQRAARQIQYNFLDTENQAGTAGLQYAADRKLGIMVMEPLRGGNLARRVPAQAAAVWQSAGLARSPAEWALRWVWNHPQVTVVLSGMNEEAHIAENIRWAAESAPDSLSESELALFSQVEQIYRRLMKAGCTGCRYCMPCPSGVNIPDCFEIYNSYHMFNDKMAKLHYLGRLYGIFSSIPAYASLCQKCGKCEAKCPQKVPIQMLLEDVARTFETRSQKAMVWLMRGFFSFQRRSSIRRAKRAGRKAG